MSDNAGLKRILATLWCVSLFTLNVASAAADPPDPCNALAAADFSQILDAPTQVIKTEMVAAADGAPHYCQVSGYVTPHVGFLLRLPVDTWNGKFIELGCGGFCGSTDHIVMCAEPLRRGYACIVSDNGHKSTGRDAIWAYNNLQAEVDHAYRAGHVTALAGKAIVESYYGKAAKKSYFHGCSAGGRQAMIEAQRFPWDFDGIIAGAPSLSPTGIHMNLLWGHRAITDGKGEPILAPADLELLHRAVLAKCDSRDGLEDGLIEDPRSCTFDPASLVCAGGKTTGCLTAGQSDAVEKIYRGPVTSGGVQVYPPSAMPGSERTWFDWFAPRTIHDFVQSKFRYDAFHPDPGPAWKLEDFDFDRDYRRLGMSQSLSDAVNPDLRKFQAAGGKLLAYHGWNDAAGMPLPMVDYYETAERISGGRAATQDFFRLFVIPGMNHCAGGDGAHSVDYLSALEAWVEKGQAPDKLIGFHVKPGEKSLPPHPARSEFSRPVYPYPTRARYLGRGDSKNAQSFKPVNP